MTIPTKRAGDFELPVLGFGTWQMGGRRERDPGNDDARDITAIRFAIDSGLTHIDTAESYAAGHAEELVAQAIAGHDRRQLIITSKVHGSHLRYDQVIRAARGSLRRLGIAKLDLYLIHSSNPDIPLKETMRAMGYLLENELIGAVGVSNFDVPLLEEARSESKYPIVNDQIHYNLGVRDYEDNGTLEYCRKNNILVTAYRPVDKGGFARAGNSVLDEIAGKNKKTPAQVALNWVMAKANMVTLVKTSNPAHLSENLGAFGWLLSAEDEKRLDNEFPRIEVVNLPH